MSSRFANSKKSLDIIEESNAIEFVINKEKYKLIISNDLSKAYFTLKDISSNTEFFSEKSL